MVVKGVAEDRGMMFVFRCALIAKKMTIITAIVTINNSTNMRLSSEVGHIDDASVLHDRIYKTRIPISMPNKDRPVR